MKTITILIHDEEENTDEIVRLRVVEGEDSEDETTISMTGKLLLHEVLPK